MGAEGWQLGGGGGDVGLEVHGSCAMGLSRSPGPSDGRVEWHVNAPPFSRTRACWPMDRARGEAAAARGRETERETER